MFTTSTVTTAPTHPDSGPKTPTTSSLSHLLSSPPPPPPPAVAVSPPENSSPRRIKSKSSLRSLRSLGSLGSSLHDDDLDDIHDQPGSDKSLIRPSILRRLSPGLAARVKLLDGSHKTATPTRSPGAVGRIPEEHIKELDSRNKDHSIKIEKRGRSWNGVHFGGKGRQPQQTESTYLEVHDPDTELPFPVESEPVEPVEESLTSVANQDPVEETLVDQTPTADASPTREVEDVEEPEEAPVAMAAVASPPAPVDIESGAPPNTQVEHVQTDFEKFIQSTGDNEAQQPPPPPPKDSPRPPSANSNVQSYFNPQGSQRPESIYSFSRASFSHQLTQLTSIPLPQPSSLEASIAAIPNAPLAVKSLTGSASQIQIWIKKASDVLSGLDAEDEVEWAAAGGREGLDGIDKAITRFEGLMNIYVKAIEDVQLRDDIGDVSADSLKTIVIQMDGILQSWADIKNRLRNVKEQVELAMEWEELWNTILGDVSAEVESLSRLLFEIEEKRHINMANAWAAEQESNSSGLDISELETIVEETPNNGSFSNSNRHSILFDAPPTLDTPLIQTPQDDSEHADLIAVFARIQPLRASLAFLPMRLSMFQCRAERIFPSACAEMEERRKGLEQSYRTLEADAEALRKEFSEDRWVLVFRNAGMQARKMFLSVERSIAKLQEALETGAHVHNPAGLAKRVESYEAKKQHYIPAIERVISLIEKGVKDQLTVNGETVNLLSDMASRMDALKRSVEVMDSSLTEYNVAPGQHLRDSISTIVTMDSPATSLIDTPGSSPPSSVVMTPANKGTGASLGSSSRRGSSVGSVARSTVAKVRRFSGIPQPTTTLTSKKSAIPKPTLTAPSPSKPSGLFTPTPAAKKVPRLPPPAKDNRPRWNSSVNTNDLEVGHVYKSSTSFRKSSAPSRTSRPLSMMSRRDLAASPAPSTTRSPSRVSSRVSSRLASRSPNRSGSPTPNRSLLDPPPYSKLRRPPGAEGINNTPRSRQSFAGMSFGRSVSHDYNRGLLSPTKAERPGTALGHGGSRRISLLPLPRNKSGRDSSAGTHSKPSERPPWR
ncbi:cortical protein KAR9-domain-containing protein [Aspergillus pseudotamarii]|uniref:Cortical protein KAR9-domain-containing protein n=1 Tax=Aspergillus pseudotamarii TaxID=132259 RepID=A0A5N6SUR5_ASPPS|nr:cortical protein KAR9-domain-containing protein [Aspergillus pseudotamarii]KAE8137579.1 cortical protein KAR9-domain-containing protein [Aspergillus pseudotamarii]